MYRIEFDKEGSMSNSVPVPFCRNVNSKIKFCSQYLLLYIKPFMN